MLFLALPFFHPLLLRSTLAKLLFIAMLFLAILFLALLVAIFNTPSQQERDYQ